MLMRSDPFRELDRLTQQVFGNTTGTWSRPATMPMDAYRAGDEFVVAFDLLGGAPEAIELDVERNVLTVKAERARPRQVTTSSCRSPSGPTARTPGNCSSATPSTPITSRPTVLRRRTVRRVALRRCRLATARVRALPPTSPHRERGSDALVHSVENRSGQWQAAAGRNASPGSHCCCSPSLLPTVPEARERSPPAKVLPRFRVSNRLRLADLR